MPVIKIPYSARSFAGGGATFISNFTKAVKPFGYNVISEGENYDILLIAGATLCEKETYRQAKEQGKKVVLRVDNILEDGKNRNSGMPRLKEYARGADIIVYQSEWAKRLLQPYCGSGVVIYNGVDTDYYYPIQKTTPKENLRIFYSKFSRNETKNFHEVIYWWREYCLDKTDDTLVLVGRYADDKLKIEHPFEFHNEEQYEYQGVITDSKRLGDIIRSCDVAFLPYFADACSNSVIECQACGIPVLYESYGGTKELVKYGQKIDWDKTPVEMVKEVLSLPKPEQFEFDLKNMGEKYNGLFNFLMAMENV